jgi:protein SCO1/2/putative membrane protein
LSRLATRLSVAAICLTACVAGARADEPLLMVGEFTLTERSGRSVSDADLRGKVWVASFVFTRCSRGCPQVTRTMQELQREFARFPDVRLVTFTVDPGHDNVDELKRYAAAYEADAERWLFLTGSEKEVYRLLHDGFHVTAEQNQGADRTPGNEVKHDTKLVLVDRDGQIRGYYEGLPATPLPGETRDDVEQRFEDGLRRLRKDVAALEGEQASDGLKEFNFPALNATLNALAGALLLLGFSAVRQRLVKLHAGLMMSALAVSAAFLASYLYYHFAIRHGKPTAFESQAPCAGPWARYFYYGILWSHISLAVPVVVLALYTAYQGLRGRIARHVGIARWTLPIWLYVSFTGVAVYWMLYRLWAPG